MGTRTTSVSGPEARTHLARLCRGFLLAREEDPRRAEAFLVTFLTELDQTSSPALASSVRGGRR